MVNLIMATQGIGRWGWYRYGDYLIRGDSAIVELHRLTGVQKCKCNSITVTAAGYQTMQQSSCSVNSMSELQGEGYVVLLL